MQYCRSTTIKEWSSYKTVKSDYMLQLTACQPRRHCERSEAIQSFFVGR